MILKITPLICTYVPCPWKASTIKPIYELKASKIDVYEQIKRKIDCIYPSLNKEVIKPQGNNIVKATLFRITLKEFQIVVWIILKAKSFYVDIGKLCVNECRVINIIKKKVNTISIVRNKLIFCKTAKSIHENKGTRYIQKLITW